MILTCDHGRGDKVKEEWTSHGEKVEGSNQIWIAVMGPDTKATGEVTNKQQLYQGQLATTIAALLGYDFKPVHPAMKPINAIPGK